MSIDPHITRRQALGAAGVTGAALLAGAARSPLGGLLGDAGGVSAAAAATATCALTPEMTEGPYWVDERLKRADVRANADGTSLQSGVPLKLSIGIVDSDGCTPYEGATVDIWHASPDGIYSDEAVEHSTGDDYLRGYQVTDADGKVSFTTVYPGWYSGRAMHIHVRIRTFDGSSTTFNYTTQIFFAESDNTAVNASSNYSDRGTRDTKNTNDNIYSADSDKDGTADGAEATIALSGSASAGYAGAISFALANLPSTTTPTTTTGDTVVHATLSKRFWRRSTTGKRTLVLKIYTKEKVNLNAHVVRGSKLLAHRRRVGVAKGHRELTVRVPRTVTAGSATLRLALKDHKGNLKHVKKTIHIPRRLSG